MGQPDPQSTQVQHPATAAILAHFDFGHLPEDLAAVSARFHDLAHELIERHQLAGAEATTMLRKLLEAKDCAVRAALEAERAL